ncbi:MAG: rubrerythrin [Thermoplasmata archaeon]|nr:rubrerythrin [Thermoplasmata archaeon]
MLSKIPIELDKIDKENIEKEVLRLAIIAELDAINLYEQMAALVEDENIKSILMDVANEEKTHVGEFQAMLLKLDSEQVEELEKGRKEVEEIIGGE